MTYTLIAGSSDVSRDLDGARIPADTANFDYQAYLAWVASGNNAAPAPAAPVPDSSVVSDRQFFQLLATQGFISTDEALAAVSTGAIPSSIDALIKQLPADEQFAVRMKIAGATEFIIGDAAAVTLTALYGWTPAQTQAFWNAAALL